MSIDTWKKEFWKINTSSVEAALKSAKLKWRGLSLEILNKHGLTKKAGHSFIEEIEFAGHYFYTSECALCTLIRAAEHGCGGCPLEKEGETCAAQWAEWVHKNDPKPMQKLLAKIKKETS